MSLFTITVIDDDNRKDGWPVQVWPLVDNHLFSGDNLSGARLAIGNEGVLGYISNTQRYSFEDIRCNVLTSINTGGPNADKILENAKELQSEIYIVDINLQKFFRGKEIEDLEWGGVKIADELKFQPTSILKDNKCFIILCSAKPDAILAMKYFKNLVVFENIKIVFMNQPDSSERLFEHVNYGLTLLQVNLVKKFSREQIRELSEIIEKVTAGNLQSFRVDAKRATTSGWSLKSLFPKQVNKILVGNEEEIKKNRNEIIGLLDNDFRKLVSKLDDHGNITHLFGQIRALDFTNPSDRKKSKYNGLQETKFDEQSTTPKAIKNGVGIDGDNFDTKKIIRDLNNFRDDETEISKDTLEILIPKWAARNTMIRNFGIYHGHIVHIARVAILNIGHHQHLDQVTKKYPPLQISSALTEGRSTLTFEFHVGKSGPHDRFIVEDGAGELWQEGKQVSIIKADGKNGLIEWTDDTEEVKLDQLTDGKLIDILKIVCYLWRSEFHYVHGKTKIIFTWDNLKKQFAFTMTEELGNTNDIKYIIKCKKVREL